MIILIAGNYQQALTWCRENNFPPCNRGRRSECIYVSHPSHLRGIRKQNVKAVLHIGTWFDRPDYLDLYRALLQVGFTPDELA